MMSLHMKSNSLSWLLCLRMFSTLLWDAGGGPCRKLGKGGHDLWFVLQDGYVNYFKGKGHKTFSASYLQLFDTIIQFCFEADLLLEDPIIDAVARLSTGLSR